MFESKKLTMNTFIEKVKELPIWDKIKADEPHLRFEHDCEIMFAALCSVLKRYCDNEKENKLERNHLIEWAKEFGITRQKRADLFKMVNIAHWDAVKDIEEIGADVFIDNFVHISLQDKKIQPCEYRLIYIVGQYLGLSKPQISEHISKRLSSLRFRTILFFDHPVVSTIISMLIILNAIQLGLATCKWFEPYRGVWFYQLDVLFVIIFSIEILCRILAFRKDFFKGPQNVFDLAVVAISWVPLPGFRWLSAFRVFRAMLLLNRLKQLKSIMRSLLDALPNIGWVSVLLGIFFYVFAVVTTSLFGAEFHSFSSIGRSLFSLFQLMTLEGWPDLVSSIMVKYPFAWLLFIPFIFITSYVFLNLVIGIIVTAMQDINLKKNSTIKQELDAIRELREELQALSMQVDTISKILDKNVNEGNDNK